ncbi:MAG: FG-GAP-like repeat-containing protein [Maioricimonas sp. JB045]
MGSATSSDRLIRTVAAGLVLLAAAALIASILLAGNVHRTVWQAAQALHCHDFAKAERLAVAALEADPECYAAAVIAGDAASALHEHDRALAYYRRVPQDGSDLSVLAQAGIGERLYVKADLAGAERCFRYVLDRWPDHFHANRRYAYLMQVQGRSAESLEPTLRVIRKGLFGAAEIHIAGCPTNRFIKDERLLKKCRRDHPDDIGPRLAEASLAVLQNDLATGEPLLEQIVDTPDAAIEAFVQLGRIYLDTSRDREYASLEQQLPEGADAHAGVWHNRALWAMHRGEIEAAIRCCYETLQRLPNHVEANYLMSQLLVRQGKPDLAERIGERARTLARIELLIPEFYDEPTVERMQGLIADFESLGRYWEAAAVCEYAALDAQGAPDWALDGLLKYSHKLRKSGDQLYPTAFLGELQPFADFPLPDWTPLEQQQSEPSSGESTGTIRFADRAADVGLDFEYFNGSLGERGMEHIFETTGGGIAALDFDRDLWPDLYFTQGAAIWHGDDPVERPDRLFRNTGVAFADVTAVAGLGDVDFSQGVTVGDFNNDGFADLYVCNLEGNRFYENNGDGTFSEVTDQTGTGGDEWSLSSVLADLDGDGLQDLYVVNYLDRASVFDRRCRKNGHPLTCAPTMFPAAQDRVYLNRGDGRFREGTDTCGVVQKEGKGLAILAADFDGSDRLSLFVGNDTTPNFFFANRTASPGELTLIEEGLISGLALDGTGRSQATMGIACGDIAGTGELTLFITNFYADSNTLYEHLGGGQFVDRTREANLRESSLSMLGFGTEYLDADLDGWLDLFITNGHVDRSDATGEPDAMPPQFYRNRGDGTFDLQDAEDVGPYFEGTYLGRTVSRLDWNRDGRQDLCVLHLYSPVALLTNDSNDSGDYLVLDLQGMTRSRDAIGTTVHVAVGDRTWTQQLVAGDGYMTSNERRLVFGLGDIEGEATVTVDWPGDSRQTFEGLRSNRHYTLVEAAQDPYLMPPPQ